MPSASAVRPCVTLPAFRLSPMPSPGRTIRATGTGQRLASVEHERTGFAAPDERDPETSRQGGQAGPHLRHLDHHQPYYDRLKALAWQIGDQVACGKGLIEPSATASTSSSDRHRRHHPQGGLVGLILTEQPAVAAIFKNSGGDVTVRFFVFRSLTISIASIRLVPAHHR